MRGFSIHVNKDILYFQVFTSLQDIFVMSLYLQVIVYIMVCIFLKVCVLFVNCAWFHNCFEFCCVPSIITFSCWLVEEEQIFRFVTVCPVHPVVADLQGPDTRHIILLKVFSFSFFSYEALFIVLHTQFANISVCFFQKVMKFLLVPRYMTV